MEIVRKFYNVGDALFTKETLTIGSKPNSKSFTIMYDCGSANEELVEEAIRDGEDIDVIFLSHYHADHIKGLQKIVRKANVNRLILPMISYPDACMTICMNLGEEQDLVWDFLIDPQSLLEKPILITNVYGNSNQREESYVDNVDFDLSDESTKNERINFGQHIKIGCEIDWIYLPYNPFFYDRETENDFFSKLSKIVNYKEPINRLNIKEIWKDRDLKKDIKDATLDLLIRFPGNPNINVTSMTLYSGPQNDAQSKLTGCLYTGDYDAKTPDSVNNILTYYSDYIELMGIILVPHHGSAYSNSELFYHPFKGKVAILSVRQGTKKIVGVENTEQILRKKKMKVYKTYSKVIERLGNYDAIINSSKSMIYYHALPSILESYLRKCIMLIMFCLSLQTYAQDLSVRSFNVDLSDQTANVKERLDFNKQPCGLIKVSLPLPNVVFEGDIIGKVEYSAGEYHVYVIDNTEILTIKHNNFHALDLTLSEKVKSKRTYRLVVNVPSSYLISEKTDDESLKKGNEYFDKGDYIGALMHFKLLADEKNNAVAQHKIGVMFVNGYGVQKDDKEAVKYFLMAAEQGYANAQRNLGSMYYNGRGVVKNYIKALEWYHKSAEQGDAEAQYSIGYMHHLGDGISKDYVEAIKWYHKSAEQGYADAENVLGHMYYNGLGVSKDYTEALKWFRKSAEQGNAVAQGNLGLTYENGSGVAKDYVEAIKWYRKSAEQGHSVSQCNLGLMYEFGKGVPKDYIEAVKWYRKSAEQGDATAQCYLGNMYYNGLGVSKDYTEAVKWYRKSVEQGYATAQCCLGNMYYNGLGVSKDYSEALKWYRKSAEQGHAQAECNLGNMYYNGLGVSKDYTEAVKWYRKSVEQGYATAQCCLGNMYYNGLGVSKDYTEALKWYRKSAEQGYAQAECNLGLMYYNGFGVSKDYVEATKWYRKSAEQGYVYAQYNLGCMYYNGIGVQKNITEAIMWFRKSAENGNQQAQDVLKQINGTY